MVLGIQVEQQHAAARQWAADRQGRDHANGLQPPVVLVGPETGERVERHVVPQQIQRRMPPLDLGVAPGFLALVETAQAKLTHVTGGIDVGRAGAQVRIDTNALPHVQPRRRGQLDIGLHADADDNQIARQPLPVHQQHGVGLDGLQGHIQAHIHAVLAMQRQQRLADDRRQYPPRQTRPGFEQRDFTAQATCRGCHFQADKTATDHHQPRPGL
ncbi:hypothetical protein PS720_05086 [Pseudomonas fluorescens]|nr:hypothetical protein PS720_05086 [Pseudomonas fluorescens]